jgi:hypothetical protein
MPPQGIIGLVMLKSHENLTGKIGSEILGYQTWYRL